MEIIMGENHPSFDKIISSGMYRQKSDNTDSGKSNKSNAGLPTRLRAAKF